MTLKVRRSARAEWTGTVRAGSGAVAFRSGVGGRLPLSLETRKSDDAPSTSPEEMLAAAHASCFAMSVKSVVDSENLQAQVGEDGVWVEATCILAIDGTSWKIEEMKLMVGLGACSTEQATEIIAKADARCPLSAVIRGNARITARPAGDPQ